MRTQPSEHTSSNVPMPSRIPSPVVWTEISLRDPTRKLVLDEVLVHLHALARNDTRPLYQGLTQGTVEDAIALVQRLKSE